MPGRRTSVSCVFDGALEDASRVGEDSGVIARGDPCMVSYGTKPGTSLQIQPMTRDGNHLRDPTTCRCEREAPHSEHAMGGNVQENQNPDSFVPAASFRVFATSSFELILSKAASHGKVMTVFQTVRSRWSPKAWIENLATQTETPRLTCNCRYVSLTPPQRRPLPRTTSDT